jgi:NTE family protein
MTTKMQDSLAVSPDFLEANKLEEGIGLSLSGGGFRAMLFHLGALVRLNECRLLTKVDRIVGVSGGALATGALGAAWNELQIDQSGVFTNLDSLVAKPLLLLARRRIDLPAIFLGLLPFVTSANVAALFYDSIMFKGKTLQDLPNHPRFVFNATSLQTGVLWRFSKEYAAEYRVGQWKTPNLKLSLVVAASAAFPPYLAPLRITVPKDSIKPLPGVDLSRSPYNARLVLADGGIYDNLGLEPIWKRYKTLLVSDGGVATPPLPVPWTNWLSQADRVVNISLQQGINMRVRMLRGLHQCGQRRVTYWGIGQSVESYDVDNTLHFSNEETLAAARVATEAERTDAARRANS